MLDPRCLGSRRNPPRMCSPNAELELLLSNKSMFAARAIVLMEQLYSIAREAKVLSPEDRFRERRM